MLSNRPLTHHDAALFVGRGREIESIADGVQAGVNTLVTGHRGMGKTSLLAMAAHRLSAARSNRTVMIEAGLAEGAAGLVELIADRAVGPRTALVDGGLSQLVSSLGSYEDRPTEGGRLLEAIDRLRSGLRADDDGSLPGDEHGPYWAPGSPVAVFVDDVPKQVLTTLFGIARDAVWTLPCVWVVSADPASVAGAGRELDLFFERRLDLAPFPADQAVEVLHARLGRPNAVPDALLREVAAASDGTPRSLVTAARQTLGDTGRRPAAAVRGAASRRAETQARAAALGRAPAMLVATLQGMGGAASASDPSLLRSLGWSRARAAQILHLLEEEGLATSEVARPAAAGRPRTVYRLVDDLR